MSPPSPPLLPLPPPLAAHSSRPFNWPPRTKTTRWRQLRPRQADVSVALGAPACWAGRLCLLVMRRTSQSDRNDNHQQHDEADNNLTGRHAHWRAKLSRLASGNLSNCVDWRPSADYYSTGPHCLGPPAETRGSPSSGRLQDSGWAREFWRRQKLTIPNGFAYCRVELDLLLVLARLFFSLSGAK